MTTETLTTPTSVHSFSSIPPFPSDIPTAPLVTISLKQLLANSPAAHDALFAASKALGFFYLDMRGCAEGEAVLADADALFDLMDGFFKLPLEEKRKYDFAAKGTYVGYKGLGREVIDAKGTRDRNEIYNISKDGVLSLSDPVLAPPLITSHRPLLKSYIAGNTTVLETLCTSLSTSLRLPPSTLSSLHRPLSSSQTHIRFIHAPPATGPTTNPTLGEHTDFGSLTILFNRVGGLQVQLPGTRTWVYVAPVAGCAVVNLGDALVKFTAGLLRSNMHRVVAPPGAQAGVGRLSLVYFLRPEDEVLMRRLEGGVVDEQPREEAEGEGEVLSSKDWVLRRHLSRKVEYFKGAETWEMGRGTEGTRDRVEG